MRKLITILLLAFSLAAHAQVPTIYNGTAPFHVAAYVNKTLYRIDPAKLNANKIETITFSKDTMWIWKSGTKSEFRIMPYLPGTAITPAKRDTIYIYERDTIVIKKVDTLKIIQPGTGTTQPVDLTALAQLAKENNFTGVNTFNKIQMGFNQSDMPFVLGSFGIQPFDINNVFWGENVRWNGKAFVTKFKGFSSFFYHTAGAVEIKVSRKSNEANTEIDYLTPIRANNLGYVGLGGNIISDNISTASFLVGPDSMVYQGFRHAKDTMDLITIKGKIVPVPRKVFIVPETNTTNALNIDALTIAPGGKVIAGRLVVSDSTRLDESFKDNPDGSKGVNVRALYGVLKIDDKNAIVPASVGFVKMVRSTAKRSLTLPPPLTGQAIWINNAGDFDIVFDVPLRIDPATTTNTLAPNRQIFIVSFGSEYEIIKKP